MANSFPVETCQPELVCLDFRFQTNGTSDPDVYVGAAGVVSDITYTATGRYSITLAPEWRFLTLVTAFADTDVTAITNTMKFVSYTASTGVLIFDSVLQDGSPAVDAPDDDTWVMVCVKLCRRSQLAPTLSI